MAETNDQGVVFDFQFLEKLQKLTSSWKQNVLEPLRQKKPERQQTLTTQSGIEIELLYTPEHLRNWNYTEKLGFPGAYPFTRGIYPNMYRGKLWTMRQYAGWGTAEETNKRFKYLLEQGQTGLSVAFDLPTQLGLDSDDERAEGEVGKVGVAVSSLKDMEQIFEGIDLSKISTSFTINATAPIILSMYLVVAEKQGLKPHQVAGTVQNDILKEFGSRGAWVFPIGPSVRLAVDCIEYCTREAKRFNPISIASHYRDAGANPAEEMAYTLSAGIAYVQETLKRGLAIDDFAPRLSFFFYTYTNFFEEIAKYRAGRRIWARLMKERFGAQEKSCMLRAACVCGGHSLTKQEPLNNITRTTIENMAVVLAGLQSVFVAAYDEAYSIPTEEAAKTALRVQQILAHETDIASTIDPLAGSYFVETLTNQMEEKIVEIMEDIERRGGFIACLESGYVQKRIAERAYQHEQAVRTGKRKILGVNLYPASEHAYQPFVVDEKEEEKQKQALAQLRAERDNEKVKQSLKRLKEEARGNQNLIPAIKECVKNYATVGEIAAVLREVFGEYEPPGVF